MARKKSGTSRTSNRTASETPEYITRPLTAAELKARVGKDNRLKVVFAVDFDRLACSSNDRTLDGLNSIVDEEVWTGVRDLIDISYRAVGVLADQNKVLVEVDADASDALDDEDETDEE